MKRMMMSILGGAFIVGSALAQAQEAPEQEKKEAAGKSWTDHIAFKGDMRLRYDVNNDDARYDEEGARYTRNEAKIRARLAMEARFEELKAGIGMATGGENPTTGDCVLGDGFTRKEIRLDLAYMEYRFVSERPYGLKLMGGKVRNPLTTLPDDLVWDSDLNPEGVAVQADFGNDFATALVTGEGLWVKHRDEQKNSTGLIGEAALKFNLSPDALLTIGGAYYSFQGIEGYDVIDWRDENNSYGNSTIPGSVSGGVTNKAWAEDFTPIVGFALLDISPGIPMSLFLQGITNPRADGENTGYSAGISFGRAKDPDTFECGYSYTRLEKDATLGMFTDGSRWGGGTDGKGSKFYAKYQIIKNLFAMATFYLDQKKISGEDGGSDYNRLYLDLQATF